MAGRLLHRLESGGLVLLEILEEDRIRIELRSAVTPDEHIHIFKEMLHVLTEALKEIGY